MYGLVLEGGGAKGSYHIGAYKAILEEGIEIKGITGTSIGALNGAMIVQGDFDKCCELWEDISYSKVINTNDEEIERLKNLKPEKEDLIYLAEKIKSVITDRGFDITPFKELLDKYIDEDKIRNSQMDFGIVTINLSEFKPIEIFIEDIPYGELKNYLLASAYLPVFRSEKIGGIRFLDGGFYDNLPFKLLKSKGYENLIMVRTHAKGLTRKINLDEINGIVISPSEDIGRSYTYEQDIARRNIKLGYYDGLKTIRGLKGNKYYIEPLEEKDSYFEYLLNLNDEQINKIKELVKTPNLPEKRSLFEYIVPKMGSAMGLPRNFTYEDFIIALLEKRAEAVNIEKFNIFKFEDLLDLVRCNPIEKEENENVESGRFSRLIEKVDFSSLFNKNDIILQVANIILCNELIER